MANVTRTVNIQYNNGAFSYTDENGDLAETLKICTGYDLEWNCNGHEFTIDFADGATKTESPIQLRQVKSTSGRTLAYTVTATVPKGSQYKVFPYSVTIRDNGDKDDPRIQVQNPTGG